MRISLHVILAKLELMAKLQNEENTMIKNSQREFEEELKREREQEEKIRNVENLIDEANRWHRAKLIRAYAK